LKELAQWAGEAVEEVEAAHAEGVALRCRMLVPTMPAENKTPRILSAPRKPDWLDHDWGEDVLDAFEIHLAEAA
jgi:hypothetical protein